MFQSSTRCEVRSRDFEHVGRPAREPGEEIVAVGVGGGRGDQGIAAAVAQVDGYVGEPGFTRAEQSVTVGVVPDPVADAHPVEPEVDRHVGAIVAQNRARVVVDSREISGGLVGGLVRDIDAIAEGDDARHVAARPAGDRGGPGDVVVVVDIVVGVGDRVGRHQEARQGCLAGGHYGVVVARCQVGELPLAARVGGRGGHLDVAAVDDPVAVVAPELHGHTRDPRLADVGPTVGIEVGEHQVAECVDRIWGEAEVERQVGVRVGRSEHHRVGHGLGVGSGGSVGLAGRRRERGYREGARHGLIAGGRRALVAVVATHRRIRAGNVSQVEARCSRGLSRLVGRYPDQVVGRCGQAVEHVDAVRVGGGRAEQGIDRVDAAVAVEVGVDLHGHAGDAAFGGVSGAAAIGVAGAVVVPDQVADPQPVEPEIDRIVGVAVDERVGIGVGR